MPTWFILTAVIGVLFVGALIVAAGWLIVSYFSRRRDADNRPRD